MTNSPVANVEADVLADLGAAKALHDMLERYRLAIELSLEHSVGETREDRFTQQDRQRDHRRDRYRRRCHHLTEHGLGTGRRKRDHERHRLSFLSRQDQGEEELVPSLDEGEDGGREQRPEAISAGR